MKQSKASSSIALLGIALANARQGINVALCSAGMVASEEAFHRACRLVQNATDVSRIYSGNGAEEIRFVSGGRIRFFGYRDQMRGFDLDMELVDDVRLPASGES